jgi:hypothetical protein
VQSEISSVLCPIKPPYSWRKGASWEPCRLSLSVVVGVRCICTWRATRCFRVLEHTQVRGTRRSSPIIYVCPWPCVLGMYIATQMLYLYVATTSCKPLYPNNKFAVMPRHGRIIIYRIYVPLCVFSIHISARVNRYVRCSLESLLTLYRMFLPRNGYHSQEHVNSFSDHM